MRFNNTTNIAETNGTFLQDRTPPLTANQLEAIFGPPDNGPGDKTIYEWRIKWDDGIRKGVFTLYDWKSYAGLSKDVPYEWHIGGFNEDAVRAALWIIAEGLGRIGRGDRDEVVRRTIEAWGTIARGDKIRRISPRPE